MANGGGMVIDPDMWGGGGVTGGDDGGGGGDPGATGGTPPVTTGADPNALQLTQLLPANPAKGWGTSYYPVYTDQGDIGAVIPGTLTNQRVRLVDPSTGQTLAEGVGNDGAQQIATLANAIGKQLGGKAAYNVQVEMQPDQFTTVGGDDINHPHSNLLKTLVQIAAPLLGAAIPGLGPVLGAALGGFGGTLATGGNLQSALLSALTSGVGNSLGGAASDLFRAAPVSFAGSNPLGGLLGHLGDALSGAGGAAGSVAGNSGGLLSALTNGAGGALGSAANEVSPLVVTALANGGLGAGLTGALGTALGSLAPGLISGAGGSGVTSTNPAGGQPGAGGTEVSPVTVTAATPGGGIPIPGVTGIGGGSSGGTGGTSGTGVTTDSGAGGDNPQGQHPGVFSDFFSQDNLLNLLGQTVGGVGGDLGVYGLAQLLGLFGPGGVDGSNLTAPGFDGSTDPTAPGGVPGTPGAGTPGGGTPPGGGLPGATFGPGAGSGGGGGLGDAGGGGALGQAIGLANLGGSGGAVAPLAASPTLNVRGSTAPDIFPWRDNKFGTGQEA